MPHRVLQAVLIASTLAFSWLAMQVVHELGHVLNACASGGRVTRVLLAPLEISRTDVAPNPHPRLVAWGGPLWGSALPVALWLGARKAGFSRAWWLRFFAGFCLVANGGYLFAGSWYPAGDAATLLAEGASRVSLIAFGCLTIVPGFALWNGLGPRFGLGAGAQRVDRQLALGALAALVALVAGEWLWMHLTAA